MSEPKETNEKKFSPEFQEIRETLQRTLMVARDNNRRLDMAMKKIGIYTDDPSSPITINPIDPKVFQKLDELSASETTHLDTIIQRLIDIEKSFCNINASLDIIDNLLK